MLSKYLWPALGGWRSALLACRPPRARARRAYKWVPASQYDVPIPKHAFHPMTVMRCHWEITPIIVITAATMMWVLVYVVYMFRNKMECVYEKGGRSISDAMDLCRPTFHKMYDTGNTPYLPWPEMAEVLADMEEVEQRQYRILLGRD